MQRAERSSSGFNNHLLASFLSLLETRFYELPLQFAALIRYNGNNNKFRSGGFFSDYRYSKDVVYNNFPWPTPTPEQKAKIEQTAQAILDARRLYPDCSLADLYDEATMPPELRKAHQQNDRAVMQAYGFSVKNMTESTCVAELMKLYQQLVDGQK